MNIDFQGVYPNEFHVFDVYFASIVSLQYHPGAGTKENKKLSLEECRDIAVDMLKLRRDLAVYGSPRLEEVPCHGEQQ